MGEKRENTVSNPHSDQIQRIYEAQPGSNYSSKGKIIQQWKRFFVEIADFKIHPMMNAALVFLYIVVHNNKISLERCNLPQKQSETVSKTHKLPPCPLWRRLPDRGTSKPCNSCRSGPQIWCKDKTNCKTRDNSCTVRHQSRDRGHSRLVASWISRS